METTLFTYLQSRFIQHLYFWNTNILNVKGYEEILYKIETAKEVQELKLVIDDFNKNNMDSLNIEELEKQFEIFYKEIMEPYKAREYAKSKGLDYDVEEYHEARNK